MRRAKTRSGKRPRVVIEPSDEQRLLRAIDRWADGGALVPLRTRAFVLLLWDGSLRTSSALALNVEDVVKDPRARHPDVLKVILHRACKANRHEARQIVLSERAQHAIADYLRAAQKGDWLAGGHLRGPLFLSSTPRGAGQRLSQRSAIHWWELFQRSRASHCSRDYELDDLVYTGRLQFMEAAQDDIATLASHAGLSRRWAAEYLSSSRISPQAVMAKLDSRR